MRTPSTYSRPMMVRLVAVRAADDTRDLAGTDGRAGLPERKDVARDDVGVMALARRRGRPPVD